MWRKSGSFLLFPMCCGLVLLKKYVKNDLTVPNYCKVPNSPFFWYPSCRGPALVTGHTWCHALLVFLQGRKAQNLDTGPGAS